MRFVLTMRHEALQEPSLTFVNGILMLKYSYLSISSSSDSHSLGLVFVLGALETCEDKRDLLIEISIKQFHWITSRI